MDADYDPNAPSTSGTSKKKKGKRKTKFLEAVEQEKPVFDPSEYVVLAGVMYCILTLMSFDIGRHLRKTYALNFILLLLKKVKAYTYCEL